MAKIDDIAAYIIQEKGVMTTWKLQKLLYYSLAWHAVWEDELLFADEFEAWANGPVVTAIYKQHRGQFQVGAWDGNAEALTEDEKESVDVVLNSYGNLSGRQLSTLTHAEAPWKQARGDLDPTVRSDEVITVDSMVEYYSALESSDAPEVSELELES